MAGWICTLAASANRVPGACPVRMISVRRTSRIAVTCYVDPGCPWGYSVEPALRVLEWRYRDQLSWRYVVIGLTEDARQYVDRGYTPAWMAAQYVGFRRRGIPFATDPRRR